MLHAKYWTWLFEPTKSMAGNSLLIWFVRITYTIGLFLTLFGINLLEYTNGLSMGLIVLGIICFMPRIITWFEAFEDFKEELFGEI